MVILKHLQSQYQRIKELYLRYERVLMPVTLVFGFIVDYITFTSIQINITFTILLVYWFIAGLTILFIHLYDEKKIGYTFRYIRLFAPLLLQFLFGALLGASFIFYWFSGSFSVSWPFILLLVVLMISNDIFREYFQKSLIQISVYFFVSFSLFSVILPFLFNSLSSWLFVASGVLSIGIFYGFISLITTISRSVQTNKKTLWIVIVSILIIMNLFYVTNIIPPIPLSVREAGVYHTITKIGSEYSLMREKENFFDRLIPGKTMHIRENTPVYIYSAVFAPTKLTTTIYHQWDYFDESKNRWVRKDILSFPIRGGRNEGYRGYTEKSQLEPGLWRVSVKTPKGQVLGRVRFGVKIVDYQIELQEVIK